MISSNENHNEDIPRVIHAVDSSLSLVSVISTDNDIQFSPNVTKPSLLLGRFRGFNRDSPLSSKAPSKPQRKQSRVDLGQSPSAEPNSTHNATFTTYADPMNSPFDRFQLISTIESPDSRRSSISSSTPLTMPVRKASNSSFHNLKTREKSHTNLHNAIFKEGNERSVALQTPRKGRSPVFLKKAKKELLPPISPTLKSRKKSHTNHHNAIFKEGNERSVALQTPRKGRSPMFLKKAKKELLPPFSPKLFKWIASPGKPK